MALISSPGHYSDVDEFNKAILGEETCLEGGVFGPSLLRTTSNYHQPEEAQYSSIDFKSGYANIMHTCESLLSFEQSEQQASQNSFSKINNHKAESYSMWEGNPRLLEELSCFQTASNYSSITNTTTKDSQQGDHGTYGWLYSEATVVADSIQDSGTHQTFFNKRAHTVIFFNFARLVLQTRAINFCQACISKYLRILMLMAIIHVPYFSNTFKCLLTYVTIKFTRYIIYSNTDWSN